MIPSIDKAAENKPKGQEAAVVFMFKIHHMSLGYLNCCFLPMNYVYYILFELCILIENDFADPNWILTLADLQSFTSYEALNEDVRPQ